MTARAKKSELVQSGEVHPLAMLATAIERGQDPETLEKLMDLADRWEARNARKAFEAAMAAASAGFKPMKRTGRSKTGAFFSIGDIRAGVDAALRDNGLSFRWRTENTADEIAVICVVSHISGHAEETTLRARPSSAKISTRDGREVINDIQAIGSAQTYLQRYTLMSALGISSGESEDDGAAAGVTISADQYQTLSGLIEEKGVPEVAVLKRYDIAALHELPAAKYADCLNRVATYQANGAAK